MKRLRSLLARRGAGNGHNPVPFDGWFSWDPHPWRHPWLTRKNLSEAAEFSRCFLEEERRVLQHADPRSFRFAFCGNMANSLYQRAVPLRRAGLNVEMVLHPHDTFVMSHPAWEEFDGTIDGTDLDYPSLVAKEVPLPSVDGVQQLQQPNDWSRTAAERAAFVDPEKLPRYWSYYCFLNTYEALQQMDALWCTQAPYFGYLSERPYVASQCGGDMWIEASRGDTLGALQRASFGGARVFLVSNPWSFAHARRYGFDNMVYLPLILDQDVHKPGPGAARAAWQEASGGDFFILSTTRKDEQDKGSSIGMKGFAAFSRSHPGARLVLVRWGRDREQAERLTQDLGIADKVIWLPLSGKRRVRDYLRSADCFIDQFVLGYYGVGGLEAMACGLPMIGRLERDQYDALCETGAPPVRQATCAEEVARHLVELAGNADFRKGLGEEHRSWFLANHGSDRWLADYQAVLTATALRRPASFLRSPLAERLTPEERSYHARGLAAAPPFLSVA
jgi:glycosyltransferase involved in cell wall biosynthesis